MMLPYRALALLRERPLGAWLALLGASALLALYGATVAYASWEVEATEAEGVQIHPSRSFKRIVPNGDGRVGGLECVHVTFMAFDETGRLTLETEPDSEHIIPCDIIVSPHW